MRGKELIIFHIKNNLFPIFGLEGTEDYIKEIDYNSLKSTMKNFTHEDFLQYKEDYLAVYKEILHG